MSKHRQLKAARERALQERRELKQAKKEAARIAKENGQLPPAQDELAAAAPDEPGQ